MCLSAASRQLVWRVCTAAEVRRGGKMSHSETSGASFCSELHPKTARNVWILTPGSSHGAPHCHVTRKTFSSGMQWLSLWGSLFGASYYSDTKLLSSNHLKPQENFCVSIVSSGLEKGQELCWMSNCRCISMPTGPFVEMEFILVTG